jgi:hypothetical protein
MVNLVFDHISAHQAPQDKRFLFIQVQIRFNRPVRSATVRSLRRVTPFEPFTLFYRTCRGHVGRKRNNATTKRSYASIEGNQVTQLKNAVSNNQVEDAAKVIGPAFLVKMSAHVQRPLRRRLTKIPLRITRLRSQPYHALLLAKTRPPSMRIFKSFNCRAVS